MFQICRQPTPKPQPPLQELLLEMAELTESEAGGVEAADLVRSELRALNPTPCTPNPQLKTSVVISLW